MGHYIKHVMNDDSGRELHIEISPSNEYVRLTIGTDTTVEALHFEHSFEELVETIIAVHADLQAIREKGSR
jgi:hypothetical protein